MKTAMKLLAVLLMATVMAGCEDEEVEMGGIQFDLSMENVAGERTNTFKQGEDFKFIFTATNVSEQDIYVGDFRSVISKSPELFHVYSKDGKDYGKPWDNIINQFIYYLDENLYAILHPNQTLKWSCDWVSGWGEAPLGGSLCPYRDGGEEKTNDPLPAGKYYSEFEVDLNGQMNRKFHIDFEIVE